MEEKEEATHSTRVGREREGNCQRKGGGEEREYVCGG
jgi:hypothetical protein